VGLYSGPFLHSVLDRFGFVSAVMEISIHSLLNGATRAMGTVAVIDVFRAFTTADVALASGASSILMVRTVEEALALRDAGIGQICFAPRGETGHSVAKHGRGSRPVTRWFRLGNSPFEVSSADLRGKTIEVEPSRLSTAAPSGGGVGTHYELS